MDWTRVEMLLNADLDKVAAKAAHAGTALAALDTKIRAEQANVEAALGALQARLDALPGAIGEERGHAARYEAGIAKAQGIGRADLAATAAARRDEHGARAAALEAELAAGEGELERLDDALTRLGDKQLSLAERLAALGPEAAAPRPTTRPADAAGAKPAAAATPAKPAAAAAAKPAAAADDLDAQFAEFLAGMGGLEAAAPSKPARALAAPVEDDDDGIPELISVRDDALPEGADVDSDGPIDFSSLDALAAREAGKPAPPAAKGAAAAKTTVPAKAGAAVPAKAGAAVPAKAGAAVPAKAGAAPGAGAPAEAGGSRKVLWIALGGTILAAGGTLAALVGLGIL